MIFIGSDNFPPWKIYKYLDYCFIISVLYYINFIIEFKIFKILIILSILVGTYEFRPNSKYIKFLDCINCPEWKNEVIKWDLI